VPIEEYGKDKNFPGKIIRVLNAKGGRIGHSSGGAVLKNKKIGCQIK